MSVICNQPTVVGLSTAKLLARSKPTSWVGYITLRTVDCVWNVMAHTQKPDFVFSQNRQVHWNRQGHQFSQLLAAEVCASTVVMLDTPCSEVVCS